MEGCGVEAQPTTAYRHIGHLVSEWVTETGDSRWSYDNLLNNVMIPMEHYTPDGTSVNPTQRGFNGPLFIMQEPPLNDDPFMKALATGTNSPLVPDLNDPNYGNIGVGANQVFGNASLFRIHQHSFIYC